jgi:hypothetical protein
MSDRESEAVLIAVLVLLAFLWGGSGFPFPERFTIRILLIWTTIIAVVLGMIVVVVRLQP